MPYINIISRNNKYVTFFISDHPSVRSSWKPRINLAIPNYVSRCFKIWLMNISNLLRIEIIFGVATSSACENMKSSPLRTIADWLYSRNNKFFSYKIFNSDLRINCSNVSLSNRLKNLILYSRLTTYYILSWIHPSP